jgi:hypothetical protein
MQQCSMQQCSMQQCSMQQCSMQQCSMQHAACNPTASAEPSGSHPIDATQRRHEKARFEDGRTHELSVGRARRDKSVDISGFGRRRDVAADECLSVCARSPLAQAWCTTDTYVTTKLHPCIARRNAAVLLRASADERVRTQPIPACAISAIGALRSTTRRVRCPLS